MSEFSFTATAQCDTCGRYLSSSTDDCDHNGDTEYTHIFRRVNRGRSGLKGAVATMRYKWDALESRVGDDWIKYEWLGTRQYVHSILRRGIVDEIESIESIQMSAERLTYDADK